MANVGIVVFPGSCDEQDAARAVRRTPGLEPRFLWHGDSDLGGVDAVIVPGGFSYGDYLRAGAIARFAPMMDEVAQFAAAGGPVLGICNGFQVLCEAALLPGAFTAGCEPGDSLSLPVKHSFGRWYAPDEQLDELECKGQLVLRYAPGQNPNGSARDVAGVMNEVGNVLGLMPHPEHAVDELNGSADASRLFGSLAATLGAASPVAA